MCIREAEGLGDDLLKPKGVSTRARARAFVCMCMHVRVFYSSFVVVAGLTEWLVG